MIVGADTGPLNYLTLIDAVEVLPKLYGRILIPPSVRDELEDPRAPGGVCSLGSSNLLCGSRRGRKRAGRISR